MHLHDIDCFTSLKPSPARHRALSKLLDQRKESPSGANPFAGLGSSGSDLVGQGLRGALDEVDEALGLKGSATNQATIDVMLSEQGIGVIGLHGTAVEDTNATRGLGSKLGDEQRADESVHFLGLAGVAVLPVPIAQTGS